MKKDIKNIQIQCHFCNDLMDRLTYDIMGAEEEYNVIKNHSRMEADIIRLRRELNDLRKMLYPY